MDKRLQILITAGINEGMSVDQINSDLKNLALKVDKLKIGIDVDTQQLKSVVDNIGNINNLLKKTEGTSIINESQIKSIDKVNKGVQDAVRKLSELGKVDITSSTVNPLTDDIEAFTVSVTKANGEIEKFKFQLANIADGAEIKREDYELVGRQITDPITKREKEIEKVKNRVAELRTEIQRFNRAGKELPLGKGKDLNNMLDTLNKMDVSNIVQANKQLDSMNESFKRINQTATAKEGLLKQLDRMRLDGVIDDRSLRNLETRIRKAESPEQIRVLAKEYGKLRAEQVSITQVEERKIPILRQIQTLREQGVITEQKALQLERELANAQNRRAVTSIKRNVDEIREENVLRERNLRLVQQLELSLLRLSNNPAARKYKAELLDISNGLQRIGLSSRSAEQELRKVENRLKVIGIEATGTTYKTSTMMGAFQNALVNYLPSSMATY